MAAPSCFAFAILAAACAIHVAFPLTSDVAWLITVNERILDGQRLYSEILETNPPMSIWLYMPAVFIGRVLRWQPEVLVTLITLAFAFTSLVISENILRPVVSLDPVARLFALAIVVIAPVDTFAQREHYALIAVLPALAASALRYRGLRPGGGAMMLAGLGAGMTMIIKPHFALAIGLAILVAAIRQKSLRPILCLENIIAAITVLIFWGIVVWLYPEFLGYILPATQAIYLPVRVGVPIMLILPDLLFVYLVCGVLLVLYRQAFAAPPIPTLLAATVGFSLAFVIQGKGWPYQLLPATGLACLALLFAQVQKMKNPADRRFAALTMALVVLPPALLTIGTYILRPDPLIAAVGKLGPIHTIANFSPDLGVTSPLNRLLGAKLINSSPMLWRAYGAVRLGNNDPGLEPELASLIGDERKTLGRDMLASPPDVILAEIDPYNWLDWVHQDPALAPLLDTYKLVDTVQRRGVEIAVLQRTR